MRTEGKCKDKKHEGIELEILNILNKPQTTYFLLQKINQIEKFKGVTHPTLNNFLNKLVSEDKLIKIILEKTKNKSTIWMKK